MSENQYDYESFVIGGGSAGISFAIKASQFVDKVGLCDFVDTTNSGNKWGLGGTCLNVGCIPKKLMVLTSEIYQDIKFSDYFGFQNSKEIINTFNWNQLINNIRNYIKSQNFKYRMELSQNNIKYFNSKAKLIDKHTIELTNHNNTKKTITSNNIIIASGGRPRYLDIPGSVEFSITSDDFFFLENPPGKTLIIGGGYIALEIAGILIRLGIDVSIMSRSNFLKEFDSDIVEMMIRDYEKMGVKFINKSEPTKIIETKNGKTIYWNDQEKKNNKESFNTIIQAVGRESNLNDLNLLSVGIKTEKNKILVKNERTNISNIYALGDIIRLKTESINNKANELQTVASKSGSLLAERLYNNKKILMNYQNIPTVIFSPIEYACCGLSEELAIDIYSKTEIEIYYSLSEPLYSVLNHSKKDTCYFKVISLKSNNKIIGIHIYSKYASEIIQGFSISMKKGCTIEDIKNSVGIHPTIGEQIFKIKEYDDNIIINNQSC